MFWKNFVWYIFVSILVLIFVLIKFGLISYILILTLAFRSTDAGFFSFTSWFFGIQIPVDEFHYRDG